MNTIPTNKSLAFLAALGVAGIFAGCNKEPARENPAPDSAAVNGTGGAGQYIDDSALTAKVKAALAGDKAVKSSDISVTTNQGVVTLSGTVDTAEQKSAAGRDAAGVSGVKDVTNTLNTR